MGLKKEIDTKAKEWLGADNMLGYDIWDKKYRHNGESFREWLNRVSGGDKELEKLIKEKKFLFGGRILANRGLQKEGKKITYSNCYCLAPPEDSIESIFDCAKDMARTFSYGGGVGIDISKLSPRGARVNNAAETTSGSVSFMDLYSLATELIGQHGRRGALMISIDCHHPDVEEFIEVKSNLDKVTKANISIRVTDDFLEAVKNNENFRLKFIREETGEVIEKIVKAQELFGKFCKMDYDFAEPSMLFWSRIENWNLLSNNLDFKYAGTNPCAEEPLPAGGSCLLSSINLSEFVVDEFTQNARFDFQGFGDCVKKSVEALNIVLDEGLPLHPLEIQRQTVRLWRQIGVGIMGLADMLIKLGIVYGSKESIAICESIGEVMIDSAVLSSALLASVDGPYPNYSEDVMDTPFFKQNVSKKTAEYVKKYGLRNSQLLTIPPCGSIANLIGTSGGVEPVFANYYTRKTESLGDGNKYYKIFTPIAWEYLQRNNFGEDETKLPSYFITSEEINYRNRVEMQSVWQSHIDASISSTVNLPNETPLSDVEDLYLYAWENGLKGITIYRSGCAREGILTTEDTKQIEPQQTSSDDIPSADSLPRGFIVEAIQDDSAIILMRTLQTGCGHLYITAKFDPVTGDLLEVFPNKGSSGGCICSITGTTREISTASRGGIPIESTIDQMKSCPTCASYAVRAAKYGDTSKGSSCPAAIGYALEDMHSVVMDRIADDCSEDSVMVRDWEEEPVVKTDEHEDQYYIDHGVCPQCHEPLKHEGGCVICKSCSWSKCD